MARIYQTTYDAVYRLHAKFGRIPVAERDEAYWAGLIEAMAEHRAANNDAFTDALLEAVADELERECKEVQA